MDGKQTRMSAAHEDRWARRGFVVYDVHYRPWGRALPDSLRFFDAMGARNPGRPIVIFGESAGGQLAMQVARVRAVAAVVAHGPAADLRLGHPAVRRAARRAFGRARLRRFSPALTPVAGAPTIAAFAAGDVLVDGRRQARELRWVRDVHVVVLPRGPVPFIHGSVRHASLHRLLAREAAFVRAAVHRRGTSSP